MTLIEQAWAEALQTTKPGTWFAKHLYASGHWHNFFLLLDQVGGDLVNQAKAEFLLTIQPGTWYAANIGSPGHWLNGKKLLDQVVEIPPPPPPPPPVTSGKTVERVWVGIFSADTFDYSKSAKYETFISHYFDSWINQGLKYKTANPNGTCLVYCNFGNAGDSGALDIPTARSLGYLAHHNGAEIPNPWGGSSYVMDVGKPGVADAYRSAITSHWGASKWDGIFADDVNAWFNLWAAGQSIDGYSSATDYWNKAMLPLLNALAGYYRIVPNIGSWSDRPGTLDSAALACAGGMEEHFLVWESGQPLAPDGIERQYASIRNCINAGKIYHGVCHLIDPAGLRYAWGAGAIMAGDRPDLFRLSSQTAYGSAPPTWDPQLDVNLGAAIGIVLHAAGSRIWSRQFEHGLATIDTAAKTLTLN